LTPDEVRATTRPPLLSPLPVEDLLAGPVDVEGMLPSFLRGRGADKVVELLGITTEGPSVPRGPIIVAGGNEPILRAVLTHERYPRHSPAFLTYVSESDFHTHGSDGAPCAIGGELGSHRVGRVWHDTHHAWLFDWDQPAPPGTPVLDWVQ